MLKVLDHHDTPPQPHKSHETCAVLLWANCMGMETLRWRQSLDEQVATYSSSVVAPPPSTSRTEREHGSHTGGATVQCGVRSRVCVCGCSTHSLPTQPGDMIQIIGSISIRDDWTTLAKQTQSLAMGHRVVVFTVFVLVARLAATEQTKPPTLETESRKLLCCGGDLPDRGCQCLSLLNRAH